MADGIQDPFVDIPVAGREEDATPQRTKTPKKKATARSSKKKETTRSSEKKKTTAADDQNTKKRRHSGRKYIFPRKCMQRNSLVLPRTNFIRLCRDIANKSRPEGDEIRAQVQAMRLLQVAAEQYLSKVYRNAFVILNAKNASTLTGAVLQAANDMT